MENNHWWSDVFYHHSRASNNSMSPSALFLLRFIPLSSFHRNFQRWDILLLYSRNDHFTEVRFSLFSFVFSFLKLIRQKKHKLVQQHKLIHSEDFPVEENLDLQLNFNFNIKLLNCLAAEARQSESELFFLVSWPIGLQIEVGKKCQWEMFEKKLKCWIKKKKKSLLF